jgi:lipopolysaccharide transport system permease protein
MFMPLFREMGARRELFKSLVVRNLKIRYKGSALGFLWSLMDPILMVAVYFLFAKLTRFQVDLPYLLSGVLTWQFLSLCIGDSFHAVTGNPSLVKKVYFPRLILPLTMSVANLINFMLTLVVLFGFLLLSGVDFQFTRWLYLPVVIFMEFLIGTGLALFVSSVMVYFRDTQHLVGIGMMAWFFLSPVIYPLHLVPEKYLSIYLLNPMCTVLMGFRACLLGQPFIWGPATAGAVLIALGLLIFGFWTFTKLEPCFSDEL